MTNEELKIKFTELLPAASFEEGGEWLNLICITGRIQIICHTTSLNTGSLF